MLAGATCAPHLRVRGEGEWLGVRLHAGPPKLELGAAAVVTWELLYPGVDYGSLRVGAEFDVMEGPRRVGRGVVVRRWTAASPAP